MTEHLFTGEPPTAVGTATPKARPSPEGELLAKQFNEAIYNIGLAIVLAGAAYPIILAIGLSIYSLVDLCVSRQPSFDVGEPVIAPLMIGLFGAVVGLAWTAMVAVGVLPLVYLFVRSLDLRGSIVRLGAFCGGLVGFVAVMPYFFGIMTTATPTAFAVVSLLGPGLTTIMGQAGGALGGWRTRWYEQAVEQASVGGDLNSGRGSVAKRLQFRIWHVLVISLWASLLLTAVRLSGLGFSFAFAMVAAWAAYQTVTLWLGGVLAAQIGQWRARRQTRST